MADGDQSDSTFTSALGTLGAIAGFMWGGTAGDLDPDTGFWVGALCGALLGGIAGSVAGAVLDTALRILVGVISAAAILLRIYLRLSAMGA